MAIKGKGKTKPRPEVRAPRKAPVPVKPPFAQRRGVQLVAAFVAGLLVFWGGVWLTNGLREERAAEDERTGAIQRRQAGTAWEQLVTTEVGRIGTVQQGQPPVILPQVRAGIRDLQRGRSEGVVARLRAAAADAQAVTEAIGSFELSRRLSGKGFDRAGVLRFLSARDELVTAIDLYREAALLGVIAGGLEGDARADLLERAQAHLGRADTAVSRFSLHHTDALSAAGIVPQPALPGA
jgi:hypothetical protein